MLQKKNPELMLSVYYMTQLCFLLYRSFIAAHFYWGRVRALFDYIAKYVTWGEEGCSCLKLLRGNVVIWLKESARSKERFDL